MIGNIFWNRVQIAVPTKEIEVIVYDASVGQVTTGKFDGKEWSTYETNCSAEITHWAFLPYHPV